MGCGRFAGIRYHLRLVTANGGEPTYRFRVVARLDCGKLQPGRRGFTSGAYNSGGGSRLYGVAQQQVQSPHITIYR